MLICSVFIMTLSGCKVTAFLPNFKINQKIYCISLESNMAFRFFQKSRYFIYIRLHLLLRRIKHIIIITCCRNSCNRENSLP